MKITFLFIILIFIQQTGTCFAKSSNFQMKNISKDHNYINDKNNSIKSESRHKIGIASGAVYMVDDNKSALGLAVKYRYNIVVAPRELGFVICADNVFTSKSHFGLGMGLGFTALKHLDIFLLPGIVFHGNETLLNANIGLGYGFNVRGLHILVPLLNLRMVKRVTFSLAFIWEEDYNARTPINIPGLIHRSVLP